MRSLDRITFPFAAGATALIALVTILTALTFEHAGGYTPCALCLIERYAYYVGIPLAAGAFFLTTPKPSGFVILLLALCGIGFLINGGLGVYHSGVEWKWWPGPESCSAGSLAPLSGNLLDALNNAKAVSCADAPWSLLGLSFAGWSAVISFGLAALSFIGVRSARAL